MEYQTLTKENLKELRETCFGGADGDIYLDDARENALKLFYRFSSSKSVQNRLTLLEELSSIPELKQVAALPEKLVFVPSANRAGFWMHYYKSGIDLETWTRINKDNYQKTLEMYKKISVILRRLHLDYGIVISDCYYYNILIIDDEFPIFIDVDSWEFDGIKNKNISRILYDYAEHMRFNYRNKSLYLKHTRESDNAALWLMYFESALDLPVRKLAFRKFPEIIKRNGTSQIIQEITKMISNPELSEVPYFHEVARQYTLHK